MTENLKCGNCYSIGLSDQDDGGITRHVPSHQYESFGCEMAKCESSVLILERHQILYWVKLKDLQLANLCIPFNGLGLTSTLNSA